MGFAKIKGNLTSRIGCPVRFGAPRDVDARGGLPSHGVIVDEVWAEPEINTSPARVLDHDHDWGDYSFTSQLIRWGDGRHTIRLAYYRRRAGEDHWEYASQMTVNGEPAVMKVLLEQTLQRKDWFQN